jgi:outer membrane protein TolC
MNLTTRFLLSTLLAVGTPIALSAQATTLEQAIELALARNPGLAVEAARTLESEADYRTARAPLKPSLAASAYSYQLNGSRLGPVTPTGTSLYTRESLVALTGRQLLYDWGRASRARDAAGLGRDGQQMALAAARDETIYAVTQNFYRALAAAEFVRVAQDALARDQAFEGMAAEFFRAGKATRLDGLKAETARLDAERSLTVAREALAVAVVRLAQAVGIDGKDPIVPQGSLPQDLLDPPALDQAFESALTANPDLQRAARQVEQARAIGRSVRGASYPDLALQASLGYRERNLGGGQPEWLVGLEVSWPLFSGGALSAGVAKADARLTQAEESRRAATLDLQTQVRDALAGWRTAQSNALSGIRIVATAREAVRAAESLYAAGKATALDVLTTQADLARADGAQVTALTDYAISRARLARLTGTSLPEVAR